MSAGKLTPQEAAEMALTSAARGIKIEGVPVVDMVVRAIELYEFSRKRVQLTPEQAKEFEERVECLQIVTRNSAVVIAERSGADVLLKTAELLSEHPRSWYFAPDDLRQLAAVCEALASNLERFPS